MGVYGFYSKELPRRRFCACFNWERRVLKTRNAAID